MTAVKKDGEVCLEYMKSVEIEKRIRQESREEERKLLVRAFKCAKENGYTTVSQLTDAGYDEETAATAIDMLNM